MHYIKTFGFFKLKNNWFVFRQLSFLQKLMFLFIYGCLIILSPVIMCCIPLIAISEHESVKSVTEQFDEIFSDMMCTAVFAFFINFNYKLAWWDPLLECCCGVGKYPEYKQQYWITRQKIIDKLKDIENM